MREVINAVLFTNSTADNWFFSVVVFRFLARMRILVASTALSSFVSLCLLLLLVVVCRAGAVPHVSDVVNDATEAVVYFNEEKRVQWAHQSESTTSSNTNEEDTSEQQLNREEEDAVKRELWRGHDDDVGYERNWRGSRRKILGGSSGPDSAPTFQYSDSKTQVQSLSLSLLFVSSL